MLNPYDPPTDVLAELKPIRDIESTPNWVVIILSAVMFAPILLGLLIGLTISIVSLFSTH